MGLQTRSIAEVLPRRLALLAVPVVVGILLLPLLGSTSAARAAGCPNEAIREEQGSTYLPECRAYEMVTPTEKDNGEPLIVVAGAYEPSPTGFISARAALSGNRFAWASEQVMPGSKTPGVEFLSSRGPGGWTSENVIPPQNEWIGLGCPALVTMPAYSADLSKSVLADGWGQVGSFKGEGQGCGHDEPRLVPGEPEGFQNLFLRDTESNTYRLINVTPPDAPEPKLAPENHGQYFPAAFLAGSSDLSHVVFEEELPLTANAGQGDELYEWADGVVHLVTVLPDGDPVNGSLASSTRNTTVEERTGGTFVPANIAQYRNAVSADGDRVFFEAGGDLYLRENPESESPVECVEQTDPCTVQLDRSQGSGPGGGGKFMLASADGSIAFFTDDAAAGLTSDTIPGSGTNLYRFDADTGILVDLTASIHAEVVGVTAAAEDGSDLYFVAEAGLATGAIPGAPNLYVARGDGLQFIATLDQEADGCDWMAPSCIVYPNQGGLTARASPDGRFLAFESTGSLTGYDNVGPTCVPILEGVQVSGYEPGACAEIFLYDSASATLRCASCNPDNSPPSGPAVIRFPAKNFNIEDRVAYPERNIAEDGRVFFDTRDQLSPNDTNGRRYDVYEYYQGELHLLSSGTSTADSFFLDADASGSDVFIGTAQPLVGRDRDQTYDIYDARVGGGFAEPPAAGACSGESCRAGDSGDLATQHPATESPPTPASKPHACRSKKKCAQHSKPSRHKVKKRRTGHGHRSSGKKIKARQTVARSGGGK